MTRTLVVLALLGGLASFAASGPATAHAKLCGGAHRLGCAADQYCQLAAKVCMAKTAVGVCKPRPEVCPYVVIPVCGCDGKDYFNTCLANRAGASVAHAGKCVSAAPTTNPANNTLSP